MNLPFPVQRHDPVLAAARRLEKRTEYYQGVQRRIAGTHGATVATCAWCGARFYIAWKGKARDHCGAPACDDARRRPTAEVRP